MRLRFRVEEPYSLDLTMKPSFVSSLYDRVGLNEWIKVAGFLAGKLSLKFDGKYLTAICTADVDKHFLRELVLYESGLWHGPFEHEIHKLPQWIRDSVNFLSRKFPGVRIAISPIDFNCIFVAVVLSKRARYEVFVKNWVRSLWSSYKCDLKAIANLSVHEVEAIGRSYQLRNLIRTAKDYVRIFSSIDPLSLPALLLRRRLMECWGIGPKVADAVVLFTTTDTSVLPVDTHFIKAVRELNWASNFKLPIKSFCLKYSCSEHEFELLGLPICPLSTGNVCIRELMRRVLGFLSGWVQTLTYLHGQRRRSRAM